MIRAAAVSSLAQFAHKVPSLRQSIILLLRKCLNDSDDEVRERSFFYLSILGEKLDSVTKDTNADGVSTAEEGASMDEMKNFLFDEQEFIDVDALEQFVMQERQNLEEEDTEDFTIDLKPMLLTKSQSVSNTAQQSASKSLSSQGSLQNKGSSNVS